MQGRHLRLRAIERDDLPQLWAWHNDAALQHELGSRQRIQGLSDEEAWLAQEESKVLPLEGRTFLIGGLLEDDRAEPLGCIWYGSYDPGDRHALVGLFLADPRHRGRGLGQEALELLLAYLFDELGLNKARLHVRADHGAAIGCYRKLGFVEEGRLRAHAFYGGKFHDYLSMGLLASEFHDRRQASMARPRE